MQVLNLARGLPASGATRTYEVPEELLELTRRKKEQHAQQVRAVPPEPSAGPRAPAHVTPAASQVNLLEFPEATRSSCITLTEELRVTHPGLALKSRRDPLLPWMLVYAIASVLTYLLIRIILR